MKTVGRGRDYQRALTVNLVRSLTIHKKITTTRARAQMLKRIAGTKLGGQVTLTSLAPRRGDNSLKVVVELIREEKHEDTTNKTEPNTKKVASR